MSARLTLSPFYLGANSAAHGGSIPLVFDQALAQLAQYRRSRQPNGLPQRLLSSGHPGLETTESRRPLRAD
jgi:hypothetical protein